jgi:hypothetical protein
MFREREKESARERERERERDRENYIGLEVPPPTHTYITSIQYNIFVNENAYYNLQLLHYIKCLTSVLVCVRTFCRVVQELQVKTRLLVQV